MSLKAEAGMTRGAAEASMMHPAKNPSKSVPALCIRRISLAIPECRERCIMNTPNGDAVFTGQYFTIVQFRLHLGRARAEMRDFDAH